ncbi:MAG: hypothetical protein C0606_13430 [Hyphomicrobiales bacterium]|nr:MAG: hypothetical protein C0606_13430 [Hyphomicrobiales bacterium]
MTVHAHVLSILPDDGEAFLDQPYRAFASRVGREDLAPETVRDLIADAIVRLGMDGIEAGSVVRGAVAPDVVAALVAAIAFPAPFSPMAMPEQPLGRVRQPAVRRSWLPWRREKAA